MSLPRPPKFAKKLGSGFDNIIIVKPDNRAFTKTNNPEGTAVDQSTIESFVDKFTTFRERFTEGVNTESGTVDGSEGGSVGGVVGGTEGGSEGGPKGGSKGVTLGEQQVERPPIDMPLPEPKALNLAAPADIDEHSTGSTPGTLDASGVPLPIAKDQSLLGDLINRLEASNTAYNITELNPILAQAKDGYNGPDKQSVEAKQTIVSNAFKIIVFKNDLIANSLSETKKEGFDTQSQMAHHPQIVLKSRSYLSDTERAITCPVNKFDQRIFMNDIYGDSCDDAAEQIRANEITNIRDECFRQRTMIINEQPYMHSLPTGQMVRVNNNGFGLVVL